MRIPRSAWLGCLLPLLVAHVACAPEEVRPETIPDASGIARVGGQLIVGSDRNPDALYVFEPSGEVVQVLPLVDPTGSSVSFEDIEGLEPWDDASFFLISSQSLTKSKSKLKEARNRIGRVRLDGERAVALVRENLRDALLGHLAPRVELGAGEPPLDDVNVEGIARWGESLLIGLRSPVTPRGAIVVPLENPTDIFDGKTKPRFGPPRYVPAEPDQGIRGMTADGDQVLVLLGPRASKVRARNSLVRWDPASGTAHEVDLDELDWIHTPEGIVLNGSRALIVQDVRDPSSPALFRLALPQSRTD